MDPIMMELRDGSKCFIILTHMKLENAVEMQSILVVSEFVNIFPMRYLDYLVNEKLSS